MTPVVGARDVTVDYDDHRVLHGVDLDLHAGEVVALLGGNGSGKTTLVRSIIGLTPTGAGRISLFGEPLGRFRRWREVGYVPQRSSVGLAGATVGEVCATGRLAHRPPFLPSRRSDRDAVRWALDVVGLADRQRAELSTLSGGQQQRVLIARALTTAPRLLVLDEPIAGVDLESQQVLAEVLGGLVAEGTAILVVLHEPGPLAGLVDRAVRLRDGNVVTDGPLPRSGS